MSRLDDLIGGLRRAAGTSFEVSGNPFALCHTVDVGADPHEVGAAWGEATRLPPGVAEMWTAMRSARLFEDVEYGQWGLELLSPEASFERSTYERTWRDDGVVDDDVVIGAFLGDQEVVVVDRNGAVLIALPLDPRTDWFRPASDLVEFLDMYVAADGMKFWESPVGN